MKKEYITPELETVKISAVSMLVGSLTKETENVSDESDVLAPILVTDGF